MFKIFLDIIPNRWNSLLHEVRRGQAISSSQKVLEPDLDLPRRRQSSHPLRNLVHEENRGSLCPSQEFENVILHSQPFILQAYLVGMM